MNKLTRADLPDLDDYLGRRDAVRAQVRPERAARRVQVGDRISIAFENRDTVRFQILEMMRVEEIRDEAKLSEELRVYNDLIADDGELRATLFVEITDRARIKDDLDSLIGLADNGVRLEVGEIGVEAEFEPGHAREDRISAVHYIRFRLPREARELVAAGTGPIALVVEHPGYSARAELGEVTRRALAADVGAAAPDNATT